MILVKKLITLILTFFIIDFLVGTILSEASNASKIRYSRLYKEKINADVIFIGNSRGVDSFYKPYFDSITGLNSINLSYNGLTFPLAKVLMDDYLERNNSPKIIFLETTCLYISHELLPVFKQYMTYSTPISNMMQKQYPGIFSASFFLKSYMFNSEYFLRTLYYLDKDDQALANHYTISKEYYESMEPDTEFKMIKQIDYEAVEMLKTMVVEYREKGITIVPVLAPVIDKYRNKKAIDAYVSDISSYLEIDVVDFSNAVTEINMFADAMHTNEKGARVVVDKLVNLPEIKNLMHVD